MSALSCCQQSTLQTQTFRRGQPYFLTTIAAGSKSEQSGSHRILFWKTRLDFGVDLRIGASFEQAAKIVTGKLLSKASSH